jgi:hypothetical protein
MTRRRWRGVDVVSILMLVGAVAGCSGGGDHNDGHQASGVCVLVGEQEPNATVLTAQFLGDLLVDDCVAVAGSLFDPLDVDSYRVLLQESLNLVVTLDHSPVVDFDIQVLEAETGRLIRDCGSDVVPEVCVVPFAVGAGDVAIDIVITSVVGAGTYTLTLDAQ